MDHSSDSAGWADVDRSPDPFTDMLAARRGQFEAVERLLLALLDLRPGLEVIDVGCGNGDHARAIAERVLPGGRVVGVDRSQAMIDAAQQAGGPAEALRFQVGEAERLEFGDGSFDRARASLLLLHVEEPAAVLAEMARVTRPGGFVLAAENDLGASTITGSDRELTRRVLNFMCDNIRHGWVGRQLLGLLLDAGLEEVQVQPFTIVIRELSLWQRINGDLRQLLDQGVAKAALTQDEVERWLDDVRAIDAAGKFLASFTAFAARGRKP